MSKKTIYTLGHSTHTETEFLDILHAFAIELLGDVRSLPGSRKFPQFNKENLAVSLPKAGIFYIHLAKLGGRRKVNKDSHNTRWKNPSFRAYADYMETPVFEEGMKELQDLATTQRTAFMCSEVLRWRCHRSLIADYLKAKGWKVFHIFNAEKTQEHPYTQPAEIVGNKVIYTDSERLLQ